LFRPVLSSQSPVPPRYPHSFPTRRSSDLFTGRKLQAIAGFDRTRCGTKSSSTKASPSGGSKESTRRDSARQRLPLRPESDQPPIDRKSTRLNSSHVKISYAVFCLKKKKEH